MGDSPTIILKPSDELNFAYYFGFTSNVPNELYEVEKGQIVKLTGKVYDLEKKMADYLYG